MITTLTGENDVLRGEALRQITADFLAEHGDMGLERLDGEEAGYQRMLGAAQSLPFLAARKLVVLRSPGADKDFTEKFSDFIQEVAETNDVLLVEPKLDKRLSYYKQLKKDTDFREFKVLDGPALERYLSEYAAKQGGNLRAADARMLIERVGSNQLTLQHEVEKLAAYAPNITQENIELLTDRTPQNRIFDLLEAAFGGNTRRAMALYHEQRALGDEPQKIIGMLVWQLHRMALVKTAGVRSAADIARDTKSSPYGVQKTQNLARRISLAQLKTLVSDLRAFDVRLKSESISADEVVQYYLLTLAT